MTKATTHFITPEQAKDSFKCPIARCMSTKEGANCEAADCILWRWVPLSTKDPKWRSAIVAIASETGEKAPFAKAAKEVSNNPQKYGMKLSKGYCGLGGRPEV